jgi:hypothetical protein
MWRYFFGVFDSFDTVYVDYFVFPVLEFLGIYPCNFILFKGAVRKSG